MPNLKSAKKKLRKDIKRTKENLFYKNAVKRTIRFVAKIKDKKKLEEAVKKACSIIDKAAKKRIIHKNKAAKLKSRISKLIKNIK